ncbi:MAG: hypothetical protein U5J96_04145 [Ignavibacteriaceae bacterium]|nr:hypothetical protein [Ignavibacteriaceae bacterium]
MHFSIKYQTVLVAKAVRNSINNNFTGILSALDIYALTTGRINPRIKSEPMVSPHISITDGIRYARRIAITPEIKSP